MSARYKQSLAGPWELIFGTDHTEKSQAYKDNIFLGDRTSVSTHHDWKYDPSEIRTDELPDNADVEGLVELPGSIQAQGFGHPSGMDSQWIGNLADRSFFEDDEFARYRTTGAFQLPYWLTPTHRYIGVVFFRKTIHIPPEALKGLVWLVLERVHWVSALWIDGKFIGSNDSLSVPHEYRLPECIDPGDHEIVIRVDNRIVHKVGTNAHSVSDHTQGNWNGIIGAIELCTRNLVRIIQVRSVPNVLRRSFLLEITVQNDTPLAEVVDVRTQYSQSPTTTVAGPGRHRCYHEVVMGHDAPLWDEHGPNVVELAVELYSGDDVVDTHIVLTGLREVYSSDQGLIINGSPLFLRGTLECAVFPRLGFPPTDSGEWERICTVVKSWGLNHLRFHSWCPPEAAFVAADRAGVYLQIECPSWANQGAVIGENPAFDTWLFQEAERIIDHYGNHPSFILMAYGNEPAGRIEDFLGLWVRYWKNTDGRRLYTSGAGWPIIPESDFHNIPEPRIHTWGAGLSSRINSSPPETRTDYSSWVERLDKPIISHEIGQWCAFPDFSEEEKYDGPLRAGNFLIFRERLAERGMIHQAKDFLFSSGRLQVLCYKEEIESALRTPGMGGFQLLGLSDFPGQGTALVGVLNAFWESKGYVEADEFRQFCGPFVLLAGFERRIFAWDETCTVEIGVRNATGLAHSSLRISWLLECKDTTAALSGKVEISDIPIGLSWAHSVTLDLSSVASQAVYVDAIASKAVFSLSVDGVDVQNSWDLWIYPPPPSADVPERIAVETELSSQLLEEVEGGRRIILCVASDSVRNNVIPGFSSVFWNTAWTEGQAPHTLGIHTNPLHPALAQFPTECHTNWQWWELLHERPVLVCDDLPMDEDPLVQMIDTWFRGHRLAMAVEIAVGTGSILVTTMDLTRNLSQRLVARQMRLSLQDYLNSEQIDASCTLSRQAFVTWLDAQGREL